MVTGLSMTSNRLHKTVSLVTAAAIALLFGAVAAAGEKNVLPIQFEPLHTPPARWIAEGGGLLLYGSGERVRIALPDSPRSPISTVTLASPVSSAVVAGRYAYLAQDGLGLRILDLATPQFPTDIGIVPLPGISFKVAMVSGNIVVAADRAVLTYRLHANSSPGANGEKHAMDAYDPFDLTLLGSVPVDGSRNLETLPDPSHLTLGRLLLTATGQEGLFASRDESAAAATATVTVGSNFFNPSTLNINQGDMIQWRWASGSHSSTSGGCAAGNCTQDGKWDSGVKNTGTFSFTFNDAGTFPYFCSVHTSSMTGKVVVKSTGPPPLTASSNGSPASGAAPLAVAFSGSASGGTPPYTYDWAFGDGSAGTSDQNPSHTFAQEGSYAATLTVRDTAGASAGAPPISVSVTKAGVTPPVVSSITKVAPPFSLQVTGSNFHSGIKVFIGSAPWTNFSLQSDTQLKILGGKALKAVVPKGSTTSFRFENLDGGSTTATFKR